MADPEPHDSKELKGYPYRGTDIGEYRIIYRLEENVLKIVLVGKRNDSEVYKKMKLTAGMAKMYSTFKGSLKSHWVLVTRRTETDKKMYASSQYLTWMHCNYKNDPVEKPSEDSSLPNETGGPKGLEPTRYGDWEKSGRCSDF